MGRDYGLAWLQGKFCPPMGVLIEARSASGRGTVFVLRRGVRCYSLARIQALERLLL
jgi:hypothetical protein